LVIEPRKEGLVVEAVCTINMAGVAFYRNLLKLMIVVISGKAERKIKKYCSMWAVKFAKA